MGITLPMTPASHPLALLATVTLVPSLALAQHAPARAPRQPSAAAVSRALEHITGAGFAARLGALAHDSTRGRETPSPELAKAADWIAAEFRAAGLRPAGTGFLHPFGLRHTRLDSLTTFTFGVPAAGGSLLPGWGLGRQVAMLGSGPPRDAQNLRVLLMAGAPADSAHPFADEDVREAVILLLHPLDQAVDDVINSVYAHANEAGARTVIFVATFAPDRWTRLLHRLVPERWGLAGDSSARDRRPTLLVAQTSTAAELLRAAGEDTATVLSDARRGFRALEGVTMSIAVHETLVEESTVANVVGVLEGSDPALRNEAVIFTAHYDHVGMLGGGRCRASQALPADSICNGADDDASGTVGVIELARAYAALRPRPARTLVFAALAAEERGLLGARAYLRDPAIPSERTVADINLDMIARNGPDSVGFVGKDYTSLGALVDRVVGAHPELRLMPAEHSGVYASSDHYVFAQQGVPALFLFSGAHDDLHTAADNADRADTGQAARIARLAFLIGLEVANGAERPTWDEAERARAVHP